MGAPQPGEAQARTLATLDGWMAAELAPRGTGTGRRPGQEQPRSAVGAPQRGREDTGARHTAGPRLMLGDGRERKTRGWGPVMLSLPSGSHRPPKTRCPWELKQHCVSGQTAARGKWHLF